MKAMWQNQTIAESNDTVVVEGNHYFPRDSLQATYFESSTHTSFCPWKGTASYFDIVVNGERNQNAAWFYDEPKSAASEIEGRVAFWKGVEVIA
ncbi:MAG: DUF427 domain-containing protein [Woeseiaceae bacterium]